LRIASFSRPFPGERVCGDAVAVAVDSQATTLAVIDGLGHGEEAHRAAQVAKRVIESNASLSPALLLQRCHDALRDTRGAAMGVARLAQSGSGRFAGVGNIAVSSRGQNPVHAISFGGIVGHKMRKVVECSFLLGPGDVLCLFSDGLSSRLSLEEVDTARLEESAKKLVARFGRDHDDATAALAMLD
jgi:hypothetical protein